jgi:hypothetical protein
MKQILFIILAVLVATVAIGPVYAKTLRTDDFTAQYPNNWKTEKMNRFSDLNARLTFAGNTVQMNFQVGDPTDFLFFGNDEMDVETLTTLSADLFNDGETYESGADKYMVNNHTAPYAITKFETDPNIFGKGLDMIGMVVLVHLSEDKIALVQYVAEPDDFDKFLSKAEKVIESITPSGVVNEQPETQPTADSGADSLV